MADGTVTIDLKLNKSDFKSDAESVKHILSELGVNAGSKMDSSFSKNSSKLKSTASKTHRDIVDQFGKPIRTKLEANTSNVHEKTTQAKRDINEVPKEKKTQLQANDEDVTSKTRNAKEHVDRIPNSKKTNLQAKDQASGTFRKVGNEANETGHKFHRLRDIIKGTFIGTLASNAVSSALSAVGSRLTGMVKEGMALNAATAGIERRFKGMGMSSRWVHSYMNQISFLKTRINATGADIATLQTTTTNWSRIGRKGALDMVEALGEVGDRTGMDEQGYQRLAMSIGRVGSSGKVSMGTLTRLTRVAPGLYRQLAQGAGMSQNHLKALLATGKVTTQQFQRWLANSVKSGRSAFNQYAHTQAGATVRMRASWQKLEAEMTKPLFNMKTSGLNQLADLMQSKPVQNGAKMIGDAIKQIAVWGLHILADMSKHKKDITGAMEDIVKIAGILGKDLWDDFADILHQIGLAFGLVHKNSKKAENPLHEVRLTLDGLAKDRGKIRTIADILMAIAAIHGISKVVDPLTKLAHTQVGKGTFLDSLKELPIRAGGIRHMSTAAKVELAGTVVFSGVQIANNFRKAMQSSNGNTQMRYSARGVGQTIGLAVGAILGGAKGAAIGTYIGGKAGDAMAKAWHFNTGTKRGRNVVRHYGTDTNSGYSQESSRQMTKGMRQAENSWDKFIAHMNRSQKGFHPIKSLEKGFAGLGTWFGKLTKRGRTGWHKFTDQMNHKPKGWHPIKTIQSGFHGMATWFGKLGKDSSKHMKRGWQGIKSWAGKTAVNVKNGWHGMQSWFGKLGRGMASYMKHPWRSTKQWARGVARNVRNGWNGMRSWFGKLGRATANALKSGWRGVVSWFSGIVRAIRRLWSSIAGIFGNVKKFLSGNLKVGKMHLANGTDWRRRYPIPAVVNDGTDSPATGNREGLIDTDGTIRPFPAIRDLPIWLLPGQEVMNARDMAAFGQVRHFAKGSKNFGGGVKGGVTGVASIRSLNRQLKELAKSLRTVRKLSKIKLTAKGLAKTLKDVGKLSKLIHSIDRTSRTASRTFKTMARQLTTLSRRIKDLYAVLRKNNFGRLMAKEARQAVSGLKGKGNFASAFSKLCSKFKKSAKSLSSNFHKTWSNTWKHANTTFSKWIKSTLRMQSSFKSKFERGWKSLDNGVSKTFSRFWGDMRNIAGKGMNRVISLLNSGISKINGVVHEFGGNTHSISYAGHVHYATGTGVFNNPRRPITAPTMAMVNDGTDSPETGNREALWRPSTGKIGVFEGRNVPALLMPGDEILNASETRELGLTHFAGGTGGLKALYELTKKYYKQPKQTLDAMFSQSIGMRGAIHQLATGMANSVQDQAEDWWRTLWTMVDRKINSGGGPASGLLKAVEELGRGKKYSEPLRMTATHFDCSSLVSRALKKYYHKNWAVPGGSALTVAGLWRHAHRISRSQAKPGDPIFWLPNYHVGIYAGGSRYWSAFSQDAHPQVGMHSIGESVPGVKPTFARFDGLNTEGHKSAKVKANSALERLIRRQVGKGFWKTIARIAAKYGADAISGNLHGSERSRAKQLVAMLMRIPGATKKGAIALAGNAMLESTFNPGVVNSIGAAGLWQWLGGRFSGLKRYAARHGRSWKSAGTQISYALHEPGENHIFKRVLRGHGSIASLARDFSVNWERGGHDSQHVADAIEIGHMFGYKNGGFVLNHQQAELGEGGSPEVVLPYGDPAKRQRTLALMQATIAQMQAQDGQSSEMANKQQVNVDLSATNEAIAEMNDKFDAALESLGVIQSKDTNVVVTNNINPNAAGRAIYPVIKKMDAANIRKRGANFSGYQSY